ncbi:MAG TPA: DUF1430 domain-containing protein [Candidatus Merdibacter merdavium]|uniref:DUF1430 domain-containing protein n=1 Tax=Candidatus Merdibacter merdavium TaxID=2838692 RepID=A0A9D2NPQ2_9FIRM|nr:DUF1430 domain-containing protein [Candidatus Merdibacter merdavium]
MKKLLYAYIAFVAILLFSFSYDSYNLINYYRINCVFNGMTDNEDAHYAYDLTFSDREAKEEVIRFIVDVAEANDVQFVSQNLISNDEGIMKYDYYILTEKNDWIYARLRMTSGKKVDFSDAHDSGYLSSDIHDTEAAGTFSSYDNTYFQSEEEVFQFKNAAVWFQYVENDTALFYFDTAEHGQLIADQVNQHFEDKAMMVQMEVHGALEEGFMESYRQEDILLALGCSVVVILLILFCIIMKEKREILIRRMHGQGALSIVLKQFLPVLAIAWMAFVFVLALAWIIVIHSGDPFYAELNHDLLRFAAVGAALIVPLLLLSYVYIVMTTHVIELKEAQPLNRMHLINIVLKVGISVLILMPFVTSMNMLVPNLSQYIYISMNTEQYEDYYNISYFEGRREELQEIYEQTIYFDMTDYALMSDAAAYALSGMPLDEEIRVDEYNLPLIRVNKPYLRAHKIIAEDGSILDTDELGDKTYLIPLQYKETYTPDDGDIVYVRDTGTHENLQLREPVYQVSNPIIVLYGRYDTMAISESRVYLKQPSRAAAESLLSDVTRYDYRLNNISSGVNYAKVRTMNAVQTAAGRMIMYAVVYGLFIFQFATLYLEDHKKELSISYMCGKSRLNRYGNLWLINLCVYLAMILAAMAWQGLALSYCLKFAVIFFLFDTVVMLFFIYRFEHKSIAQTLKGE